MEGIAQKIPDIWFDLYARLIPGTLLISGLYVVFGLSATNLKALNPVWLLVAGYIAGHLIQPLGSALAKWLEAICGMKAAHEEVSSAFSSTDRQMLIIAKQHAEVVGMVATGISCLLVLVGQRIGLEALIVSSQPLPVGNVRFSNWFLVVSSLVFFGFALERARAARQRCLRLKFRPEFKEYSDRIASGRTGQIVSDAPAAISSEIEDS